MNHPLSELSDFLDAQLPAARRAEVETHLSSCASCREEADRLRSVGGALKALPMQPLPAGFMQRLERRRAMAERIEEPRSSGFLPPQARLVAFALSSIVCLVVLADQVRQMLPGTLEERLPSAALSAADVDQARAAKVAVRAAARAPGEPVPGAVLNEPVINPAPASGPTNEQIIADVERQKKAMGIVAIAPKPTADQEMSKRLRAAAEDMAISRTPVLGEHDKPAELKSKAELDALSKGAAAAPAGDSGAPVAAPAAPASGPALAEGLVLRSEDERKAAWEARTLHAASPSLKYDKSMLLLVVAPDMERAVEIIGVETKADKIVVRYRMFPRLAAAGTTRLSQPVKSYQYRIIPKTDKPVVFDRAE